MKESGSLQPCSTLGVTIITINILRSGNLEGDDITRNEVDTLLYINEVWSVFLDNVGDLAIC